MTGRTWWQLAGWLGGLALTPWMCGAQSPVSVRVAGRVVDSTSTKPLAGAAVRLFRPADPSTGRTTISNADGRFVLDSVAGGVWVASFVHPVLDSLRAESPLVQLDLTETGSVDLELATPSVRALIAATCGSQLGDEDGVVIGEVRHATTNAPLALASVALEWPEWSLERKKGLSREPMRRVARTDSTGRYALCGAPKASTVTAQAWVGSDSAGVIEVEVPAGGYRVQDFAVGSALTRRATVRGRVLNIDGSPLAGAVVRVIGSGSMARTTENGAFAIPDAVAGTQSLEARAIGFEPDRRALRLSESTPTDLILTLPKRNVALDTVRVVAGRKLPPEVVALERRWRTGRGTIMDGNTVRERTSSYLSDAIVSIPGVDVRMNTQGFGQHVFMRNFKGERCRATIFVDGFPLDLGGAAAQTLDEYVSRYDIAAMEVYPRPTNVPAEYFTTRDCGVIAVWTKHGLGNVPVFDPRKR